MTDQNVTQAADATNTTTVARADVDSLPAGSAGPANGNVITGQGTDTGLNGADTVAHSPAHVVEIQGAGAPHSVANSAEVTGHFGVLTMAADGTFHYVPNAGAPAGVQDIFGYTVADASGQQSSSTLTIDLGLPGAAASQAAALPTNLPPGVVALPAGVQLSDVHVVGSDLVVHLPDGSQMVIPEGAIFVPQFVIGNVEVPAQNVAALLVDSEPKPAAGPPESAGGNFAGDVPPLDPGVPLGNLLPPTEFGYTPPQFEQPASGFHSPPTVIIETPDNPLGAVDASESVFEKGLPARGSLPAGSGEIADGNPNNNSDTSESNTGTIVFSAQDGLQSVTIDGVAVSSVGQQIQGQYGVLTITGIDLASGQITYSYTLSNNTAGDSTQDVFAVVVTDHSGDAATASLTVHVVDDVPTAHDDSASQAGVNATVSVNVIANDVQGADGVNLATGVQVVNGSLTGTGTLHYNGDGTFTYTPTTGESGDVTFQYTITDGDGDTSTATVTIHLMANSIPTISTSGGDTVDEAALSVGSNPSSPNETTAGSININSPDGIGKLIVNGVNVTNGGTVTGADGTLTVTHNADGTYSYSYTLSGPTSSDAAGDNFSLTVTDGNGDTASTTLHISIADDVPTANNDSATQGVENAPVTVNVIANDVQGADGVNLATGVHVVSGSLSGSGTLVYNSDGTFTYTPGAGEQGDVTFQYQITDGDGDTSTATVTIHLLPDSTPTISTSGGDTVDEAALPVGSDPSSPNETTTGTINITTGGDTVGKLVIDGVDVTHGGTVTGADGVLTVTLTNGVYSYSYTLSGPTSSDAAGDNFNITVTDSDGDTASTTLHINILDDVPTAHADVNSVSEGSSVGGNVLTNDVLGADGAAAGGAVTGVEAGNHTGTPVVGGAGTAIVGTYGTLTLNANGTYTYVSNPNSVSPPGATDTFTYTITDGDGDKSTTTLTINVNDVSLPADDQVKTVNEAGLPNGSSPGSSDVATGQLAVTGATGYTAETVVGTHGTLVLNADGSYTYTLTSPVTEATANNGTDTVNGVETFTYTAHDASGNTVTGTITINVTDDVPTVGTIQALTADNNPADPTSTGTLHLVPGADGLASVAITPDLTGITSGGHALIGSQSGDVYTAYADVNGNGVIDAGDTAVFTITVDPNAGTSGQYTFDLLQPLDGKIVTTPIDSSSAFGAGPAQDQILSGNSGGTPLSTISGWSTGAGFSEATWLSSGTAGGLTQQAVNGSTVGWGVNNNVFSTGEFMRFDFSQTTDYDGAGPYTPPSTALPNASTATFEIKGYTASDTIQVMVHYTDGTFGILTEHGNASHDATFVVTAPTGKYIDYVEMYAESGSGKVDLVSVGSQSTTVDVTIPVSMTFTDGDGDQTSGSTTIHVADGQTATTPNAVVQSNAVTTSMVSATPVSSTGHTGIHGNGDAWTSGRTSILMGVLAAAGLSSEPLAAKGHFATDSQTLQHDHGVVHTETFAPAALGTETSHVTVNATQPAATSVSHDIAPQHETHSSFTPAHVTTEHGPQHLPTALPSHEVGQQGAHPAAHAIVATAIHMPAAAQLLALVSQQHAAPNSVQADAGHQLGHVLADALAGGAGHVSPIDAILNNVASHGGAVGGMSPLATHFSAGVSNGDNGHLAAFTAIQTAHMEHLIAHAHAAHPHG